MTKVTSDFIVTGTQDLFLVKVPKTTTTDDNAISRINHLITFWFLLSNEVEL